MADTINVDFKSQQSAPNEISPTDLKTGQNQNFINQKFLETYQIKQHLKVIPTYQPKNFFEQFVFYDDGTNRYLYIFINGVWRRTSLT